MEQEKLENMLIDYIDGKLDKDSIEAIEQELARNSNARVLYDQLKEVLQAMDNSSGLQPGDALKSSFDQLLTNEIVHAQREKSVILIPMFYRIAAGVILLMVVGVTAYWINKDREYQEQMAILTKELQENKRIMMAMIDNQQSASQRMIGVSVAYEMNKPDDEILRVLIKTMNSDPNTNVRMAALEALGKFHTEPDVRKALISSLSIQKDPVVQIALIQLMVTMKEKIIVNQLRQITKDAKTMNAVKDAAYSGILKLS